MTSLGHPWDPLGTHWEAKRCAIRQKGDVKSRDGSHMAPGDNKGCPKSLKDNKIETSRRKKNPKWRPWPPELMICLKYFGRMCFMSTHNNYCFGLFFNLRSLPHLATQPGHLEGRSTCVWPKLEQGTKHINAVRIDPPAIQPPQRSRGQPDSITLQMFICLYLLKLKRVKVRRAARRF